MTFPLSSTSPVQLGVPYRAVFTRDTGVDADVNVNVNVNADFHFNIHFYVDVDSVDSSVVVVIVDLGYFFVVHNVGVKETAVAVVILAGILLDVLLSLLFADINVVPNPANIKRGKTHTHTK